MPLEPTHSKRDTIEQLLHEGGKVMIVLDARCDRVLVPPQHQGDPRLHIVLNLRAPNPIHFETEGISSTLFFGGVPTPCHFPWDAIWAAYIPDVDRGAVWEESVPIDMPPAIPPEAASLLDEDEPAPSEPPPERPTFSIIEGEHGDSPKKGGTSGGKKRKKPDLKVIR